MNSALRLPMLASLIAAYEPTRRQRRPDLGLDRTLIDDRSVAVTEQPILERPFYRLIRFRRATRRRDPRVLVVAPLSGHFSALLRDMLDALLPDHEVYLVDWRDARDIAPEHGPFGIEHNVAEIIDCIHAVDGDLNVIGVCQSAIPVLAATALLAGDRQAIEPASMILINGMIDPRIQPTRIGRVAASRSCAWLERVALSKVPAPFAGAGRPVYPATLQHQALLAYLARHVATGGELFSKFWNDDAEDAARHPFIELYLSVMDLPALILLDTVRQVFQQAALATGRMTWRGDKVDPSAIRHTALMTIEGGRDDVSGSGQTRIAQTLCVNIPAAARAHHVQSDVGHFGTFHGRIWRSDILPRLRAFIRAPRSRSGDRR